MAMTTITVRMEPTFPFGRHRGKLLDDIPLDYLRWLLRSADAMDPPLRKSVRAEVDRRREGMANVQFVTRGDGPVHLSLDGDLPLCGSFYSWRGYESFSSHNPGGRVCARGCFR
jgi:hypothetical protein